MVKRGAWMGILGCAAAAALAGCGGSTGLVGTLNAGTISGIPNVHPGQPVNSVAALQNRSGHSVTLDSATILPLKGFRSPKLIGFAVESRGRTLRGVTTRGAWTGSPRQRRVLLPLHGHELPPRGSWDRNTAFIVFTVLADHPGRFALAGLTMRVVDNGSRVTAQAIGPLAFCVSSKQRVVTCPSRFTNRAFRASIELR